MNNNTFIENLHAYSYCIKNNYISHCVSTICKYEKVIKLAMYYLFYKKLNAKFLVANS